MTAENRRTQLVDAAIATLAREGSRGLTHRAVDRTAGVAEGSSSYYFRTRQALLGAIVQRLSELDAHEIPALSTSSRAAFARSFALLVRTLATRQRDRQLARYELVLEASRRPEIREALNASSALVEARMTEAFAALDVPAADVRAREFMALVDGLLLHELSGTSPRAGSTRSLERVLRRFLDAAAAGES